MKFSRFMIVSPFVLAFNLPLGSGAHAVKNGVQNETKDSQTPSVTGTPKKRSNPTAQDPIHRKPLNRKLFKSAPNEGDTLEWINAQMAEIKTAFKARYAIEERIQ